MRFLFSLVFLGGMCFGGWWLWNNYPPLHRFIENNVVKNAFNTLEIRYTAEQIMKAHKRELLKNSGYSFLEPKLTFYPYLLMEVKFTKENQTTGEGVLLWSLTHGEMVIDASTWDTTHGFEDCLLCKANKDDFKIIQAIAEHEGAVDRDQLYKFLKVDNDLLDKWIESCRLKKLIVVNGNTVRLHLENPKFTTIPSTQLDEWLVTIPSKHSSCVKKRYSIREIRKITTNAFGSDFTIRKENEVHLPVYSITIKNPDGSVLNTYWNALNGKRLDSQTQIAASIGS